MDILSRLTTLANNFLKQTYVEYLDALSITVAEEVQQVSHELSWIDPLVQYLIEGTLPNSPSKAKRLKWMASQYVLLDR